MDIENLLKSVDSVCLFIAIVLFLMIKFLKYLLGLEKMAMTFFCHN